MKVLYLYISNDMSNESAWISENLPEGEYHFTSTPIPDGSLSKRLLKTLFLPSPLKKYDVIVTTEYYLSFFLNIRLLLTGCKAKHVVWGLNQSRRLLVFRYNFINKIVNYIFNRTNAIITHSKREKKLFSNIHGVSPGKFKFVHWGYDLPLLSDSKYVNFDGDYICMIGRNNRDWKAFANAVASLGVMGVAVCSNVSESDRNALQSKGVYIYENLSMEDCLNVIKYAAANVVLVKDDSRGAGHITVVSAMLMSKPQVISKVDVLNDYFEDGVHGYTIPIDSDEELIEAIRSIIMNPQLSIEFGRNAKEYADNWFSNKHVADEFCCVSRKILCDKSFGLD